MDNSIVVSFTMKLNNWMQHTITQNWNHARWKKTKKRVPCGILRTPGSRKTESVNEGWHLDGSYLEGVTGRRQKVGYFGGAANVLFLDLGSDSIGLGPEYLSNSYAYHSSVFLYVGFTSINSLLKRMYFSLPSWKQLQHLHCLEKSFFCGFFFFCHSKTRETKMLVSHSESISKQINSKVSGFTGFPGGASAGELACNAGDVRDLGSIPGLGRSPGRGDGIPLQYPRLENPKDRGAWWTAVHRVEKSWTQLKWLSTRASGFTSDLLVDSLHPVS